MMTLEVKRLNHEGTCSPLPHPPTPPLPICSHASPVLRREAPDPEGVRMQCKAAVKPEAGYVLARSTDGGHGGVMCV
jgi:hypothetical protein